VKRPVLLVTALLVACAVLGALCGVAWWLWWKPAPLGIVFERHPFFLPDEEFRSTGTYVAIAAPVGLLLGGLGTWRLRHRPLFGVLALVAGAVVGGAAMLLTGWLLGPESALALAREARDGAVAHAALRVQPGVAWFVMPVATACGCLAVLLSVEPHAHASREMDDERS
jgi:hypothetical protein